jgi:hypothetical protein
MPWFALAYALVSRVSGEVKWRSEVQKQRIQEERGRSRERRRNMRPATARVSCQTARDGRPNLLVDKTEPT